jgi:hypothetical protein
MSAPPYFGPLGCAQALRREISRRNLAFALKRKLAHHTSYGDVPVTCYLPSEDGSEHGNFLSETYRAIVRTDAWRRRTEKVHTQARTALPREERRWRELDACTSSDALLMNIFCFPGLLKDERVLRFLGIEGEPVPEFGFKARVPLLNGKVDRTEVDLKIGDLLIEAKLTESDFQAKPVHVLDPYRDFVHVFHRHDLPRRENKYLGYQLIRNVLAAYAHQCSFCVMTDARRPDLIEAWYAVLSCVSSAELRVRCKIVTWQELAELLPSKLQAFLKEKYGIGACDSIETDRID